MKKIMLLGGSQQQIIAIKKARSMGLYTILCDYYPDNPGIKFADEFFCISTTDKEAVLKLAKKKKINGILAYASEPAVMTAAYVCREMNLPTDPFDSIEILSLKDLFRGFQRENGFNCPNSGRYISLDEAVRSLPDFNMPVMVKPVDSSGSKGISAVHKQDRFEASFYRAMERSRLKAVLVEEFVNMKHECMIGGDCYIIDGKLAFCGFLNSHRDDFTNPFVPVGTSYPPFVEQKKLNRVRNEIQRMIDLLGLKNGALNIEILFDKNDDLYIIEIGHRNGGNMIPDLLEMVTGVDLVKAGIDSALGNKAVLQFSFPEVCYMTYVIHSQISGKFADVTISDRLSDKIVKMVKYKQKGDDIKIFDSADKAIGIIFFKADSIEDIRSIFLDANTGIRVVMDHG